jgi:prophage DNA circulation protein
MPIDPTTKRSDLDVLATTSLAQWRDVPFVCGPLSFGFDQQHAIHTYPDRDAGYVESTGRNLATYTFTAIFRRGVVGDGGGSDAFPNGMLRFLAACADRTAGDLDHPILGKVRAKCQNVRAQVDPNRRDGADVEVSFIEATDREDELTALLQQSSALGSSYDAARSFDSAYGAISPEPPALPESLKPSLLDSIKQLDGAIAQAQLGVGNVLSKIDGMANAVNNLSDRIASLDDPKNDRALGALEKLFASLVRLARETQRQARPIRPAILDRPMSVVEAAGTYGTPLGAFLKLNPLAAAVEVLAPGSTVFVYA